MKEKALLDYNKLVVKKPHIAKLAAMQCDVINVPYKFINRHPYWFNDFYWTKRQRNKFRQKAIWYIYFNKAAQEELLTVYKPTLKQIKKAVDYYILNHGWRERKNE